MLGKSMALFRGIFFVVTTLMVACSHDMATQEANDPLPDIDLLSPEETFVDDVLVPEEDLAPDIDATHSTKVLCTGQMNCAAVQSFMECPEVGEAFFGQDGQYAAQGMCTKREYAVTEEIVVDTYTGLMWQRILPPTYDGCAGGVPEGSLCSWQEASDYCHGLSLDGRDDWRLPTTGELEILVNYGRYNPSIDTTAFPDSSQELFWTASVDLNDEGLSWYVNFRHGYVYRSDKKNNYHARCVCGSGMGHKPLFSELIIQGEEIVIDDLTGMMWTKKYWDSTWEEALRYCELINYATFRDWRLPNINELKTLIERETAAPASLFPGMPRNSFWSSTTYPAAYYLSMHVDMMTGDVYGEFKGNVHFVRCVR
ncbi:MAG TPA: DUF1566 domain-containing protein [bacterium]|nr:DUF1566 domain-containing protein [bacterium]